MVQSVYMAPEGRKKHQDDFKGVFVRKIGSHGPVVDALQDKVASKALQPRHLLVQAGDALSCFYLFAAGNFLLMILL